MKFKKIKYVIGFIYPKDWRVIPWIDSCPCPFPCIGFATEQGAELGRDVFH